MLHTYLWCQVFLFDKRGLWADGNFFNFLADRLRFVNGFCLVLNNSRRCIAEDIIIDFLARQLVLWFDLFLIDNGDRRANHCIVDRDGACAAR